MKEGWKYTTIGEVVAIKTGKLDANAAVANGEYPFFTCAQNPLNIDTYSFDCECVLVAGNGDLNVKYYKGKFDAYQRTYVLTVKGVFLHKLSTIYLYWFMQLYLDELRKKRVGATVKYIKLGDLTNINIPIPPLPEQERIVSLLDAEFAKIDAIKANAEKQLKDAKALFQSALKDYLTPKEGWEEKYLHEISSYYNGLTYKPTDVSNTGTLVLRSSNIQNNCLSLEDKVKVSIDVNEKLKVHKGDIIMCSRNGSKALIGKVALVPYEYSNLTFGTFMMIIKSTLNPYLYFYFLSDNFKKQIWKGEANMINQITRYMLDEVLVQYPKNEDEQRRIVKKLHELSAKIQSLQSNFDTTVTLCNDLKQSILKDIFG